MSQASILKDNCETDVRAFVPQVIGRGAEFGAREGSIAKHLDLRYLLIIFISR